VTVERAPLLNPVMARFPLSYNRTGGAGDRDRTGMASLEASLSAQLLRVLLACAGIRRPCERPYVSPVAPRLRHAAGTLIVSLDQG